MGFLLPFLAFCTHPFRLLALFPSTAVDHTKVITWAFLNCLWIPSYKPACNFLCFRLDEDLRRNGRENGTSSSPFLTADILKMLLEHGCLKTITTFDRCWNSFSVHLGRFPFLYIWRRRSTKELDTLVVEPQNKLQSHLQLLWWKMRSYPLLCSQKTRHSHYSYVHEKAVTLAPASLLKWCTVNSKPGDGFSTFWKHKLVVVSTVSRIGLNVLEDPSSMFNSPVTLK